MVSASKNVDKNKAIVDKSFLQGASLYELKEASKKFKLVITDTLFYEILSSANDTEKCITKLNQLAGTDCLFIQDLGYLLDFEALEKIPTDHPSKHLQMEQDVETILHYYRSYPSALADALINKRHQNTEKTARLMIWEMNNWQKRRLHWFSKKEGDSNNVTLLSKISQIIGSSELVQMLCSRYFAYVNGELKKEELTPRWITYTWCQVIFFYSVDLYNRHEADSLLDDNGCVRTRMMNEVSDMEYVALALMEDMLLTRDKRMQNAYDSLIAIRHQVSEH